MRRLPFLTKSGRRALLFLEWILILGIIAAHVICTLIGFDVIITPTSPFTAFDLETLRRFLAKDNR